MSPKYTLYYFKLHARGEPIRVVFHYAGQAFEEINWELNEFSSWREKMPFGQSPMLEVDGDDGQRWHFAQSTAILRYLACSLDLDAETPELQAICAMHGEYISADVVPALLRYGALWYGLEAASARKHITWVDFMLAAFVQLLKAVDEDAFKNYPLLQAHYRMIYGLPELRAYAKNRPNYLL